MVEYKPQIIGIGGGKGGVGKSVIAITIATVLAENNQKVALVDLDLGAANLHTYLGIHGKTPTLSDFLLGKCKSLEDVMIETSVSGLYLISGGMVSPQLANPKYQLKMKLIRHIRQLPYTWVVLDLGAGVNYNTLDFFNTSHYQIVVTQPEPGAVINAYGFLKSSLIRKIVRLFSQDKEIGKALELKQQQDDKKATLEIVEEIIKTHNPDLLPLLKELTDSFSPGLILNRSTTSGTHLLIKNLSNLCKNKLGVTPYFLGNLPNVPYISRYLTNLPSFYKTDEGADFKKAVSKVLEALKNDPQVNYEIDPEQFNDEERDRLINLIDSLDESLISKNRKSILKLKVFFKPHEVINQLTKLGLKLEGILN